MRNGILDYFILQEQFQYDIDSFRFFTLDNVKVIQLPIINNNISSKLLYVTGIFRATRCVHIGAKMFSNLNSRVAESTGARLNEDSLSRL